MQMTSGKTVGLYGMDDYKYDEWKARPLGRANEDKTKNDYERKRYGREAGAGKNAHTQPEACTLTPPGWAVLRSIKTDGAGAQKRARSPSEQFTIATREPFACLSRLTKPATRPSEDLKKPLSYAEAARAKLVIKEPDAYIIPEVTEDEKDHVSIQHMKFKFYRT